jgi:DNA-binding winged helix-turn-helix (wHTH) protein
MPGGRPLVFPPFSLDRGSQTLTRGAERLPLRPKAFLLLRYLAEHPGRLISRVELLQAIWRHVHVSEGLLRGYVRELRRVLGDDARFPRFIETMGGRGYRFIAPVGPAESGTFLPGPPANFVGRREELARLHRALERALRGERQVVFVTGEAGIGKTALVDAFLAEAAGVPDLRVARGQCIEHHGAAEAYSSLLEALAGLAREGRAHLRRQAPSWLAQLPALADEAELETLGRGGYGAVPERMARELAEGLETLAAESPLLLWLKDLHWSDLSTLDFLAMLARRRGPARLLVVGTYRPADAIARAHPLRALIRELSARGQCSELPLPFLTPPEVARYLALRFSPPEDQAARLEEWGRLIHRRTEGNPLFMVAMADDLVRRAVLPAAPESPWPAPSAPSGLPESLRQLIDNQSDRLSQEERRTLEAASVAGIEFSAAWVAAELGTDTLEVEERCESLAGRHLFLHAAPESDAAPAGSDRRHTERYRFVHALYQEVLYQALPGARRRVLHLRVGEAKEAAFGARSAEIAAELAVHFERGGDPLRAARYFGQAARSALRRAAVREAASLLQRALDQLGKLPDGPERADQELGLQVMLGASLAAAHGFTAPEVGQAYERAHTLCRLAGQRPELFSALYGLCRHDLLRGEPHRARELAEQMLRLAEGPSGASALPAAQACCGAVRFFEGELPAARAHLEQGLRSYQREIHGPVVLDHGADPGVSCLGFLTLALHALGHADQALARGREGLALGEALSHPLVLIRALLMSAILHLLRREPDRVLAARQGAMELNRAHGPLPYQESLFDLLHGWALAEQGRAQEGAARLRRGIDAYAGMGVGMWRPDWLVIWLQPRAARGGRRKGSPPSPRRRPSRRAPGSAGMHPSCHGCRAS